MKLSISNIAWEFVNDACIYEYMHYTGYSALEIAPTRIFPENPYVQLDRARKWSENIYRDYGFSISSMQSIWHGKQERIFGTAEERQSLIDYTKKAIDFAEAIGCKNLVFGCPRNRNVTGKSDTMLAIPFFREIGNYAVEHGTVIAMEANPSIYNTNYINDTPSALRLIEEVNSAGFRLNLDIGTIIENEESMEELTRYFKFISHVHISEPGLKPLVKRNLHQELKDILLREKYKGFVSIEMAKTQDTDIIKDAMDYVREIFY